MTLFVGLVIIAITVFAVLKRVDVRLALLVSAVALGIAASLTLDPISADPILAILQTFLATLSDEKFVVPICSAVGFAYVLRATGCDRQLVNALVLPLARLRFLAIPGAVLVGFLVNVPVLSQTGTAVAVGTVLVPLMRGWRMTPVTIGAALLLGSSVGGELLNPGAPELRTIAGKLEGVATQDCIERIVPLVLIQLGAAMAIFWLLCLRSEARVREKIAETGKLPASLEQTEPPDEKRAGRVNWLKALIPLVPIALLLLTTPRYGLFEVPANWVLTPKEIESRPLVELPRDTRLVGLAMLVGIGAAALSAPRALPRVAGAFFDGAGYAYTHVISLIVAAQCFGKGVEGLQLGTWLEFVLREQRYLLLPMAAMVPLAFAWLSGSGMASTSSLYGLFLVPTQALGADPLQMGAVMSIASAAGRTLSPVSAVALMSASLTETDVFHLTRRLLLPLLAATVIMVLAAMWLR